MKKSIPTHLQLLFVFLICMVTSATAMATPHPPASEKARQTEALKILQANPNMVVMYAKGLICGSCAIGIRKKIKPLAFVDPSRLNQGITLDPKYQLLTVAVADKKKLDVKKLTQAVIDAGYQPINLYSLKNKALVTTPLNSHAPKK